MRTSRSMSCTLSSVMRAWPRIVLTSRLSRSVRAEAIGVRTRPSGEVRKYTWAMILSFGPDAARPRAAGSGTEPAERRGPRLLRRRGAAGASGFRRPCARPCCVGWIAHGVSHRRSTSPASARPLPGARFGFAPALSVTLWLVLAVYQLESRFVPLPGARRALAACGVVGRRRSPGCIPGQRASAGGIALGAAALAARHRLVRPVRRCRAARAAAQPRRAADAPRAAAPARRRPTGCRCCASSG